MDRTGASNIDDLAVLVEASSVAQGKQDTTRRPESISY
jgi:hypothetical protein